MQFDEYLSLIATGTEAGEVAVWDYELSHLLGVCHGHKKSEITQIAFLSPYPAMVTSGADCNICLWSVRPTPSKQCYICFYTFTNVSFNYHNEQTFPVRAITVWHGEKMKGITRGKAMKHQQIDARIYRDFEANQVLSHMEPQINTEMIKGKKVYRGTTQM